MIFTALPLSDAWLIEPERIEDERGFFARTFSAEEFLAHKLVPTIAQCSVSYNRKRGTLRGLHFQAPPHAEVKYVRCTRGAAFDVIVDLRPESPTFKRWTSIELSVENQRLVYIPQGFAHGFQTMVDDTELCYQISTSYVPNAARGIRWDDPELAVVWPQADQRVISTRDLALPTLAALEQSTRR